MVRWVRLMWAHGRGRSSYPQFAPRVSPSGREPLDPARTASLTPEMVIVGEWSG